MAEEQDLVESGAALGKELNMQEDRVTLEQKPTVPAGMAPSVYLSLEEEHMDGMAIDVDAKMAEERDLVELDADSNMREDRTTAKKRVKRWAISADASMERERGTLDEDEDEDDFCVGELFSDQLNMAEERDLEDLGADLNMKEDRTTAKVEIQWAISADESMERERGTLDEDENEDEDEDDFCVEELGADSNMKEDRVTAKEWRAGMTLISSDSTMEEYRVPPEVWVREPKPGMPISVDANKERDREIELPLSHDLRNISAPPTDGLNAPADEDEDAEHERLMDRRMYAHATQGYVDGVIKILDSISSKKDLQHSEILCQVSPRKNTCLHIAANFGHHDLAKYIMRECPDLIKEKNSKGDTALHIAARKRDLSFVKIVLDSCPSGSGASRDVEKAEPSLLRIVNVEENTVLHEALIHDCKQEEVVEILIKADPQVAYYPNKEGKSPLYLAAEAHYFHVVEAIEKSEVEERMMNRDRKAKPAVHGAILGKNKEMLEKILAMKLIHQKDKDRRTPLHCAASIGYLEGVQKLLDQSNFDPYQTDSDGFCPIHVASKRGYVDIVKELLQVSSDSIELLSKHSENILHVAAKYGKDNVVNFVLKEGRLENLINEKDNNGNTPLHLATMHGHPKVVNYLTWDKRVDVNLVNDKGRTAFDIAVSVEHPSFHQRLIWTALKSAGARSAGNSKVPPSSRPKPCKSPNTDEYKDRVNTLLLVSTLVATVTFAAGFTMPGGYNSSDPNAGMATLLMTNTFHMFVICNTIAMYTSILAAITLIWAQLGDLNLMDTALRFALPFLGLALTAMSLGFMAGVYLVVGNLHWLAIVVLIIGIICLVSLLVPFLLLFLPTTSTNCILRYISYYPFLMLIWASKSPEIKRKD